MVVQLKICWAYILRWGGIPGKTPNLRWGRFHPNLTWWWCFCCSPQRETATWSTSRMWFQIFCNCSPRKLGKSSTHFDLRIVFRWGWFNHHLDIYLRYLWNISLTSLVELGVVGWRVESCSTVLCMAFSFWLAWICLVGDFFYGFFHGIHRHFSPPFGEYGLLENHMFFLENHIFIDGCFFHLQS